MMIIFAGENKKSYFARKDSLLVVIRPYRKQDAVEIGKIIADTYTTYNLSHIDTQDLSLYLGPFAYAYSERQDHKNAIVQAIRADIILTAVSDGLIVGVLRGRHDKLQSLFVTKEYHRQGIGSMLVTAFEQVCREQQSVSIKVQSTLYAVPFYLAMGYRRTTGIRKMTSFQGIGLPYQPMKKILY
jgi:GNAT superfamily N-acetyltransferase